MNIQYCTHIYKPASRRDAQLGRNRHAHPDPAFRRNATCSLFVAYLTACQQMRSTVFLPNYAVLRTAKPYDRPRRQSGVDGRENVAMNMETGILRQL
jgi:hypothetical protein